MNSIEYLEACRTKLGLSSYYQLSKALDVRLTDMYFYRDGKRKARIYTCFKIASVLEIDPAVVIADIESESEKNSNKREYFKAFTSHCVKAGAMLILSTALFNSQNGEQGSKADSHNDTLSKKLGMKIRRMSSKAFKYVRAQLSLGRGVSLKA